MNKNDTFKIVVTASDGTYRAEMMTSDVKKNDSGQYVLPPKCYSSGYVYRISEQSWENYPPLPAELKHMIQYSS
jgi:hypothetical protein